MTDKSCTITSNLEVELRDLLLRCREKLKYYREASDGSYVGGYEYSALDKRLGEMLTRLAAHAPESRDG